MKFIPLSLRKTFSCRVSIVIHDKNILCPWEYQWPSRTYPSVIPYPDLQNRIVIRAWRRREGSKCFPAMISQWPNETAAYCHEPWPSSLIFLYFVYFRLLVFVDCFFLYLCDPKRRQPISMSSYLGPLPQSYLSQTLPSKLSSLTHSSFNQEIWSLIRF